MEKVIAMAARRIDLERAPLTRNETRRSKSKVRSYLRRCKEVITGHHHHHQQQSQSQEDSCKLSVTDGDHVLRSISSSHEPVIQRSSSSQFNGNSNSIEVVVVGGVDRDGIVGQECIDDANAPPPTPDTVENTGPAAMDLNLELGSDVSTVLLLLSTMRRLNWVVHRLWIIFSLMAVSFK